MVICPECGYPYEDDQMLIGSRTIRCANCSWSGNSSKLITAPEEVPVGAMQSLYEFLGKVISPQVAKKMVELGLLSTSKETENVQKIARVLSHGTRSTFQGVLSALFAEEVKDDRPN